MEKGHVGRIILAKVLSLPLSKYLDFLENMTHDRPPPCPTDELVRRRKVCARVVVENGAPEFQMTDPRLSKIYSVPNSGDDKLICSLNWINTRNRFSVHLMEKLMHCQFGYWRSGREADLRPLSLQQFLARYPLGYLDASRLSRLVAGLSVLTPWQEILGLRRLFPSGRRVAAVRIKELVNQTPHCLNDREIENLLAREGLPLSRRTVCHCRRLLNIPNHRKRRNGYFGKDVAFGQLLRLAEKKFSRIPSEPGVYELSLPWKLNYPKGSSEVIYIGCTRDLRKRIASYSGNGLKNPRLKEFVCAGQALVRFCRADHYCALEKQLLANFRHHFGALPNANRMCAQL